MLNMSQLLLNKRGGKAHFGILAFHPTVEHCFEFQSICKFMHENISLKYNSPFAVYINTVI